MKNCHCFVLFAILLLLYRIGYGQENLTFTINGVSFNMIFVEGGSFVMGCTPEQGSCYPDEKPSHTVTLTDFLIGEFEVTQKLWQAVMGTTVRQQWLLQTTRNREAFQRINSSITFDVEGFYAEDFAKAIPLNGEGDLYPIYFINYNECELFCTRLNEILADQLPEGYKFRIPTEAQWEYAARGGKMSQGYAFCGSDNINETGWYDTNSNKTAHEVGSRIKNELGFYDMNGNVCEWCRDKYDENYYKNSTEVNPKGPNKGKEYVLRGGSWNQNMWACRTIARFHDQVDARTPNYGFRLALEPPQKLTGSGYFGYTRNFNNTRLASGKNLTFKANDVKFEMAFVEGGDFLMGCMSNDSNCDSMEMPAHHVKLSNYYLSKMTVTQKLWRTVMGTSIQQQRDLENPKWELYGEGDQYPMYYVNYEECAAFCEKLNTLLYAQLPEGYKFRLPTEAQWEYAARGGRKKKSYAYSGNDNISKVAWWEENCGNKMREVGLKADNTLGIFDMSGNVWEWCRDWFEADYYSYGSTTNPQGPLFGTQRVLRGGSWNLEAWHSRVTTRSQYAPTRSSANLGFRIVLEPAKDLFDLKNLRNTAKKFSALTSSSKNCNFKINDLYFKMIFVEGGTFNMGCTSDPEQCFENEEPVHSVTLSDFYVGEYQVTQQLWNKVMGATVSEQRDLGNPEWELCGEGDYYPIYYINYEECELFCKKLNQLLNKQLPEGYIFSLPTEAQWEYAARGGKKSKMHTYSGGNNVLSVAWYIDNCKLQTHEVGIKNKNELGIYDMSGNVWEWCRDWFDLDYYRRSPSTDPTGPDKGYYRILRGGSWRSNAQGCRVSFRNVRPPNQRGDNYGVRVALVKD